METTTIQISKELRDALESRKLSKNESYEEVISDMIEDTMELSEETKRDIAKSREDVAKGRVHTLAEVKKKFNL